MNRNTRSITLYLIMGILFMLMVIGLREGLTTRSYLTYTEFIHCLDEGTVAEVDITPNQEVPTGTL